MGSEKFALASRETKTVDENEDLIQATRVVVRAIVHPPTRLPA